jgi:hypothetical protein
MIIAAPVAVQMLMNDPGQHHQGYPLSFSPDQMEDADNGLIPTERFAQQPEKLINGELRAKDKKK